MLSLPFAATVTAAIDNDFYQRLGDAYAMIAPIEAGGR